MAAIILSYHFDVSELALIAISIPLFYDKRLAHAVGCDNVPDLCDFHSHKFVFMTLMQCNKGRGVSFLQNMSH